MIVWLNLMIFECGGTQQLIFAFKSEVVQLQRYIAHHGRYVMLSEGERSSDRS